MSVIILVGFRLVMCSFLLRLDSVLYFFFLVFRYENMMHKYDN